MTKAEKFKQLSCTQAVRDNLRSSSVRSAAFTGVSSAIDFIISMGSRAILARLIIPEHFGLFMMVTAVTMVADQFRDLGLSAATVQKKDITHEEVTNLFWVNVAAGLSMTLVICALAPLISLYYKESRLTIITCVLATNFVLGSLMVQHQALLTRQLKLGKTSSIRLASSFLSTVLAIILAFQGFGYWALVWREVARSVFLTAGMWFSFPWIPGLPSRKTDIRGLIHFGTNLAGANILASLSSGVDRFFLGRYWGPSPVGMYGQATQVLARPMEQVLGPIYQVSQPGLSMLQSEAPRFRRFYQKVLGLVCVATMPVSIFVAVYSFEITRIILGHKWVDSAPILMILSFGTFIKQAVGSAAWVLITRGKASTYLALTVLQNAAIIIFMFVGVKWGTKGVAMADVGAAYLLMWPKLHYSLKDSPVSIRDFFSALARPALSSLGMGAALLLLKWMIPTANTPVRLALGCMVAAVAFPLTWLITPGGKKEAASLFADLKSVLRKRAASTKQNNTLLTSSDEVNGLNKPQIVEANAPRVSVILTVYKRTEYLAEALDGVLAQTYPDYEVIVADDSGTGIARAIVDSRAKIDKRVRYRANLSTLGVATSLAEAVKSARGTYITILNDDDLWENTYLEEMIAPLQKDEDRVLSFCDIWMMDAEGQIDHALSEKWSIAFDRASLPAGILAEPARMCVLRQVVPVAVAALFKKDAFDWALVVPQVTGAYDYWIACLLAATGKPIVFVPKRLARWRMHAQMETRRRSHDKGENLVYIFSTLVEQGWFPELRVPLKEKLADSLFATGKDKLHFGRIAEARIYLWRSLLAGFRIRCLANLVLACLPEWVRNGVVKLKALTGKMGGGEKVPNFP